VNNLNFPNAERKRQGEWAEVCFMARAMEHGLIVSRPYGDSSRYDFLVESAGLISRVQVKSVGVCHKNAFRISAGRGMKNKHSYSPDDADFIAALIIPHSAWYIIPVTQVFPRKTLRVCPHRPSIRRLERYCEAWDLLRDAP